MIWVHHSGQVVRYPQPIYGIGGSVGAKVACWLVSGSSLGDLGSGLASAHWKKYNQL